jgi:hypothetical protein
MHASVTQLAAVVILLVASVLVVLTPTWPNFQPGFRGAVAVLMLILIVVGMAIPGQLRIKLKKQACLDALSYLRATRHPTLTGIPFPVMRSTKAFDKFIESITPKRPV